MMNYNEDITNDFSILEKCFQNVYITNNFINIFIILK